jgi:vacuolar-type H+-ATPase catalytic subunit A/Vma1
MDKEYLLLQKDIKKIVSNISKNTHVEREELECQANLIFVECYNKFNSTKNMDFKTYFTQTLFFDLFRYVRKFNKQIQDTHSNIERISDIRQGKKDIKEICFDSYSEDSKMIIDLLLNNNIIFPEENNLINKKENEKRKSEFEVKVNKKMIKNYLLSQNWKESRINKSFREISISL